MESMERCPNSLQPPSNPEEALMREVCPLCNRTQVLEERNDIMVFPIHKHTPHTMDEIDQKVEADRKAAQAVQDKLKGV